jgi:hypothetical protein
MSPLKEEDDYNRERSLTGVKAQSYTNDIVADIKIQVATSKRFVRENSVCFSRFPIHFNLTHTGLNNGHPKRITYQSGKINS